MLIRTQAAVCFVCICQFGPSAGDSLLDVVSGAEPGQQSSIRQALRKQSDELMQTTGDSQARAETMQQTFTAQAEQMQSRIHHQAIQSEAKLNAQREAFMAKLSEQADASAAVQRRIEDLRQHVVALQHEVEDLKQSVPESQQAIETLRALLSSSEGKILTARDFLADSLRLTDNSKNEEIRVLGPKNAVSLERMLSAVNEKFQPARAGARKRRGALVQVTREEPWPMRATDVVHPLVQSIEKLSQEQDQVASSLKTWFLSEHEAGEKRYAQLLSREEELKGREVELQNTKASLSLATKSLEAEKKEVLGSLGAVRTFAQRLDANLGDAVARVERHVDQSH